MNEELILDLLSDYCGARYKIVLHSLSKHFTLSICIDHIDASIFILSRKVFTRWKRLRRKKIPIN